MRSPTREYARCVAESRSATWRDALAGPARLLLLLGIVTPIAATGRITASLVVSETLCWIFVPALQLVLGTALIASARGRRVDLPRAVQLLFAGHAPWSLWLVGIAAYYTVAAGQLVVLGSSLASVAATWAILLAFCEQVLGLSHRDSWRRVIAHQLATLTVIVLYVELASSLVTRVVGLFR